MVIQSLLKGHAWYGATDWKAITCVRFPYESIAAGILNLARKSPSQISHLNLSSLTALLFLEIFLEILCLLGGFQI